LFLGDATSISSRCIQAMSLAIAASASSRAAPR
jgi:hypothetical protein